MGGLGHELSWGLLAEHIFLAVRRRQLICWIGLAVAELGAISVDDYVEPDL